MSLFLGNLSSHVRRDELERVFRRFGRCKIQLKDGYGFVIYDIPANAEKALRVFRGKNICGEPISLTWANKQPRPFQRFARGARLYEPYHRRNFTKGEDYGMRKVGLHDQPEYRIGNKHLDSDSRVPQFDDALDKEIDHHQEDAGDHVGEKLRNPKEGFVDEGGSTEPNPVDNNRWGEPAIDLLNDIEVENGADFDRYEPYHGFDRRDEDENHQMSGSNGSALRGNSEEKHWREHTGEASLKQPGNSKPQQTCYICGLMGHRMRNCPRADASQREKFTRFDRGRDGRISFRGRGEGKFKRVRPSWGRPTSSRDRTLGRQHRTDKREHGTGKSRKLVRKSDISPASKETRGFQLRRDNRGKKRSRTEPGTPKKHRGRKARRLSSSPLHSNSIASSSRSHSSKSVLGISSRSRSRSVSSRSPSVSFSSRSTSTSSYSRSESSSSRSRLSSPSSLSLSISPGRPLPSSPNLAPMKAVGASPKRCLENATNHLLVEQRQLAENEASSENSKLEHASGTVPNKNTLSSLKIEDEMNKDHFSQVDDDGNHSTSRIGFELTNPCMSSLEKGAFPAENSCSEFLIEKKELQKSEPPVIEYAQSSSGKLNQEFTFNSIEHSESPSGKLDPEFPFTFQTNNSTRISSEEMYRVLKHYGLALPEENEKHLPIETFFGSARMWPWEIIYYRRLKKGPISTENYARRIAQNREFGIVDKYVRSSSGWGESDQNNY